MAVSRHDQQEIEHKLDRLTAEQRVELKDELARDLEYYKSNLDPKFREYNLQLPYSGQEVLIKIETLLAIECREQSLGWLAKTKRRFALVNYFTRF